MYGDFTPLTRYSLEITVKLNELVYNKINM